MTTPPPDPADTFVIRRNDGWVLTPAAGTDPVPVGLDDVVDLIRRTDGDCPFWGPPGPTGERSSSPIPPGEWILAPSAFLGHACRGGLHVEGRDASRALLDAQDLRLLDQLADQVCTVADLAAQVPDLPPDEVARRLGAMEAVGRLRLTGPPAADQGPARPRRRTAEERIRDLGRPLKRRLEAAFDRGRPAVPDDRIPVYSVWQVEVGPNLALGMLLAAARAHREGALETTYELRPMEAPDDFLADLARRQGPAILFCSNYVWSLEHNLELARRAKALNPDLLVVHGGPSTPKYDQDARDFAREHAEVADVLVRGEGELTTIALLEALVAGDGFADRSRLHGVAGLSFVDVDGELVRNPDRDRVADLDTLPSPYLTGEFDHIPLSAYTSVLSIETNRGCPYGCTFCDWGSATLARIRKFDLERVKAELTWAAQRGITEWNVTDANFGIVSRDVEISEHIAALRTSYGVPRYFGFTVAKNTTKHLARIVEILADAGMSTQTSLSLQTRDDATLDAVDRANIKSDHYVELAAEFRRRAIPLQGDLMLGLPGQTPASYKADLQFMLDHEITARTWLTQLLPNAPMNEPGYRERFEIRTSEEGVVVSTTSFTDADRQRMMRIRFAHTVAEHFGLLRHLGRYLQWEHDLPVMDFAERVMDLAEANGDRYPLLNWTMRYFDLYTVPPLGWDAFYREVRRLLRDEFGLEADPALDTVLAVQQFLMPEIGRRLPAVVDLHHDYLAYYRDATAELYRSGRATGPKRPLAAYPAGRLEVYGDPADLSGWRMRPFDDSRDEWYVRPFWVSAIFELDSPLVRNLPETRLVGQWRGIDERHEELARLRAEHEPAPKATRIPVRAG